MYEICLFIQHQKFSETFQLKSKTFPIKKLQNTSATF